MKLSHRVILLTTYYITGCDERFNFTGLIYFQQGLGIILQYILHCLNFIDYIKSYSDGVYIFPFLFIF